MARNNLWMLHQIEWLVELELERTLPTDLDATHNPYAEMRMAPEFSQQACLRCQIAGAPVGRVDLARGAHIERGKALHVPR